MMRSSGTVMWSWASRVEKSIDVPLLFEDVHCYYLNIHFGHKHNQR